MSRELVHTNTSKKPQTNIRQNPTKYRITVVIRLIIRNRIRQYHE